MKVFISYGALPDQVTALRLQALGSAHGLTLYVPPAHTRSGFTPIFDSTSQAKLIECDLVLGVIGTGISEMCSQELNIGLSMKKNVMVMASPNVAVTLAETFGTNLVVIDPANPGTAQQTIVQWLKGPMPLSFVTEPIVGRASACGGSLVRLVGDRKTPE